MALWFDVKITFISSLSFTFQRSLPFLSRFAIFPISRLGFLSQTLRPSRPGTILPPNLRSTSLPASSTCDPSNSYFFSSISPFFFYLRLWRFFLALHRRLRVKGFLSFEFAGGKNEACFLWKSGFRRASIWCREALQKIRESR